MLNKRGIALVAVALAMVVPACGDDDTGDPGDAGAAVSVTGAWSRATSEVQDTGVVYFTLTGGGDGDALLGAAVDASIAGSAQLHETVMGSDDSMGDMGGHDMGDMGAMSMQPVDAVHVDAGSTVLFEPGGYHVMLMDLAAPLVADTTFELTLTFEHAGEMIVTVQVLEG